MSKISKRRILAAPDKPHLYLDRGVWMVAIRQGISSDKIRRASVWAKGKNRREEGNWIHYNGDRREWIEKNVLGVPKYDTTTS